MPPWDNHISKINQVFFVCKTAGKNSILPDGFTLNTNQWLCTKLTGLVFDCLRPSWKSYCSSIEVIRVFLWRVESEVARSSSNWKGKTIPKWQFSEQEKWLFWSKILRLNFLHYWVRTWPWYGHLKDLRSAVRKLYYNRFVIYRALVNAVQSISKSCLKSKASLFTSERDLPS